jgi:hypothetical protein
MEGIFMVKIILLATEVTIKMLRTALIFEFRELNAAVFIYFLKDCDGIIFLGCKDFRLRASSVFQKRTQCYRNWISSFFVVKGAGGIYQ